MNKLTAVIGAAAGIWLAPAFTLQAADVPSPNAVRVVAVVNDQVISSADLKDRLQLVLLSTGLPDTAEVREKLTPQVAHMLVDEALQMQEGAHNDIKITEEDIKQAEATMEQKNGTPPGSLEANLDEHHVPKLPFYAQLRAQLTWTKLVLKKIRPHVHVTDEEVERASHKSAGSAQGPQVQISAIRLSVDNPGAQANVAALADKLASQIKGGASFEKVAQQFANGNGGQAVSELWVDESQIDPLIARALKNLPTGSITPPIKTQSGYQIIKLEGRRKAQSEPSGMMPEAELAIRQITLSLKGDAKPKEAGLMLTIAHEVAKNPGTCLDKGVAGVENLSDMNIQVTQSRQMLSKLAPDLRKVLGGVAVGDISEPYASPDGIQLYMICERVDMPAVSSTADLEEKERIRQQLYAEKMDLESQKYMRNLRRDAFIDVRLQ